MTKALDYISDGVAKWAETERVALEGPEILLDLGIDSLGVLMVTYHVAGELGLELSDIESSEEDLERLSKCVTVQDLVDYVESHTSL